MAMSPETAPPGWEHVNARPASPAPRPPPSPPSQSPAGIGQMVCGGCRELFSYPQGAIHVKCPCCQTVNFVLEAHQVGNVECGKCSVLLMYPYGAPSVRCSCCRYVTEIIAHNIRPPVSVQQGQAPQPHFERLAVSSGGTAWVADTQIHGGQFSGKLELRYVFGWPNWPQSPQ